MTPQRVALHALVVTCAGFLLIPVAAADPLGLYVGGGVGQSTVRSEQMQFTNFSGGPLDGPVSLSRLTSPLVGLGQFHRDRSSARLAYGARAQMTLGRFAIRAEYERINASEGDPDLLSLGLTLSF
jgi:hypothetical protein